MPQVALALQLSNDIRDAARIISPRFALLIATKTSRSFWRRCRHSAPHSCRQPNALHALAIPAMAMPTDAPMWVEKARTRAVSIPMISGLAQPDATGFGLGGN
jgi:hypothetical protein